MQGLTQGIEQEAGMDSPRNPSGDDALSIGFDDEGHVDEAGPGLPSRCDR